jgi:hypothetical protein
LRLRGLRGDLIDPAIAANHGRIIKRIGTATSSRTFAASSAAMLGKGAAYSSLTSRV